MNNWSTIGIGHADMQDKLVPMGVAHDLFTTFTDNRVCRCHRLTACAGCDTPSPSPLQVGTTDGGLGVLSGSVGMRETTRAGWVKRVDLSKGL